MNTAQRILKNTASLAVSGFISPIVATVVVVYLARVMGPSDFGSINFATALVTFFTLFTDMGLSLYGTREVACNRASLNDYLGGILSLKLLLSTLGFICLLLLVQFIDKPYEIKLMIVLFGLGLFPSAILVEWAFQGVEKMEYVGMSRIMSRVIYVALVMVFVKKHDQIFLVPCFQIGSIVLINSVFFLIFVKKYCIPRFCTNLSTLWAMLRSALPMGISIVVIQMILYIDTIMLGFMKTESEVGYYNAAYKLTFPVILAIAAYFDAIFPVASKYYRTSLEKLKTIQENSARLMVTFALPVAVGGVITAPSLIHLFYGKQYAQSVAVFQILVCMMAVICVNSIYARGLWSCNRQGQYLKIVIVQVCSNIFLNLILISAMGIVGAALSKIVSEMIGLVFYYREFNKILKIEVVGFIWRPLLATIVMGVFLLCARPLHVGITIPSGILVYMLALIMFKGVTKDDYMLVREVLT